MDTATEIQSKDMHMLLHESGLFDYDFYLGENNDVALAGIDPLTHYLDYGAKEGRNPNLLFSNSYYLSQYPELPASGISALAHYVLDQGHKLNPHVMFDTQFYLNNYPEVKDYGITPLAHFLKIGADCGYDPCQEFDTSFYLAQDPQIRACNLNPLIHYILYGHDEGRYTRNNFLDEFPDSLIEDYKVLTKLEPLLPKAELLPDLPLVGFLNTSRIGTAYFKLTDGIKKPFSQLFIMPDLQSLAPRARRTLDSVITTHGLEELLLLLTDSSILDHDKLIDLKLTIITLTDLVEGLTNSDKAKILVRLIVQACPHVVYNCGSEPAYEAFSEFRRQLEQFTKLVEI